MLCVRAFPYWVRISFSSGRGPFRVQRFECPAHGEGICSAQTSGRHDLCADVGERLPKKVGYDVFGCIVGNHGREVVSQLPSPQTLIVPPVQPYRFAEFPYLVDASTMSTHLFLLRLDAMRRPLRCR